MKTFKHIFILTILFFNLDSLQSQEESWPNVGDNAPKFITEKNWKQLNINSIQKTKPVVLVFYRGSWCPYCIKQLAEINQSLLPELNQLNTRLFAISVDRPSLSKKMKKQHQLNFDIISDPKAESLKAFKIINKLNDELVKKYKVSYQIDIESDSGEKHHMIAHPAVFVVYKNKIVFSDVQLDYKKRTNHSDIIKAIKVLKQDKQK